jgi:ketosteroid isomerase-like protein
VTIHLTARGAQSRIEIDQRFFQVYTLRDGKISRMVEFVDRARALEAVGLRE